MPHESAGRRNRTSLLGICIAAGCLGALWLATFERTAWAQGAAREAATKENPHLKKAIALSADQEHSQAYLELQRALMWPNNTTRQRARILLQLGITQGNLLDNAGAEASFLRALQLDSKLVLPADGSPKIESVFKKAQQIAPKPKATIEKPKAQSAKPKAKSEKPKASTLEKQTQLPPAIKVVRREITWPAWLAAGGAVAAAGVGAAFAALSKSDTDASEDLTKGYAEAKDVHDSAKTKATVANIMFGVAGAFAATSLVLFIWKPTSEKTVGERSASVEPSDDQRASDSVGGWGNGEGAVLGRN
jgi:hypothetical protein